MSNSLNFEPNNVDLVLAIFTAILMPFILEIVYVFTGALIPMIIYYGIFCILLVKWRKKSLDYRFPKKWAFSFFIMFLIAQIATQIFAALCTIPSNASSFEIFLTAVIWAPINAFMEQLSWIYVFDSIALRFSQNNRKKKIIGIVIGTLLTFTLVALIHIVFWSQFLMEINSSIIPWYYLFMAFQFINTTGYIVMYKKTNSMLPSALLHLIMDVSGVLIATYSIVPFLFKF